MPSAEQNRIYARRMLARSNFSITPNDSGLFILKDVRVPDDVGRAYPSREEAKKAIEREIKCV